MVVSRIHQKLFEATALDLDRQIRGQLAGEDIRPGYLREIENQLQAVNPPDFEAHLYHMHRVVDGGPDLGARFRRMKTWIARLLRRQSYHDACVHRMIIARLGEQHAAVKRLTATVLEANEALREELALTAEKIRAEFSEDLRRNTQAIHVGRASRVTTPPVAPGSKLVLGTMPVSRPGYVHIDPTDDNAAPLDRLPVEPGTAAEIVVANALERFPLIEVRDRLLPYWASLLQPGGRLTVVADDLAAVGDRFLDGQIDLGEFAEVIFGTQDGPPRRSVYTPEQLGRYVTEAGLTDVSVTDRRQRPEAGAYGFELAAFRPAA